MVLLVLVEATENRIDDARGSTRGFSRLGGEACQDPVLRTRRGDAHVCRSWQGRLQRVEDFTDVPNIHAHSFRDTFAVELLLASAPIERVAVLLGHASIRVTEKHYAPWIRAR